MISPYKSVTPNKILRNICSLQLNFLLRKKMSPFINPNSQKKPCPKTTNLSFRPNFYPRSPHMAIKKQRWMYLGCPKHFVKASVHSPISGMLTRKSRHLLLLKNVDCSPARILFSKITHFVGCSSLTLGNSWTCFPRSRQITPSTHNDHTRHHTPACICLSPDICMSIFTEP